MRCDSIVKKLRVLYLDVKLLLLEQNRIGGQAVRYSFQLIVYLLRFLFVCFLLTLFKAVMIVFQLEFVIFMKIGLFYLTPVFCLSFGFCGPFYAGLFYAGP